uniref:Uncharacterized protein n=1 Tax=Aquila chrysaetos chrysaetos TaxID=223781 RepID=A0A663EDF1_AQUCH
MCLTQNGSQLLENVHLTSILRCILSKNDTKNCILIAYRLYLEMDEVNSSVCTTVKEVAYTNNRIWDTAEYTIPMQANSFFVMTNTTETENQLEQRCPEVNMFRDLYLGSCFSPGIQTGRCVNYNATVKTCEVRARCAVESMEKNPEPAVLRSSEDFTVLIKNNIHFPKFNYTILNISPNLNTSYTYNNITSPLCPIFHPGDILQEAKENFSEVAVKGGIIYGFCCPDDKKINCTDLNLLFCRYARYYMLPHGKEKRTLFKVYGIQFDVLVFDTVNAILFPCGGRRKLAISLAPLLPYTPLLSPVHHSGMEVMSDE